MERNNIHPLFESVVGVLFVFSLVLLRPSRLDPIPQPPSDDGHHIHNHSALGPRYYSRVFKIHVGMDARRRVLARYMFGHSQVGFKHGVYLSVYDSTVLSDLASVQSIYKIAMHKMIQRMTSKSEQLVQTV